MEGIGENPERKGALIDNPNIVRSALARNNSNGNDSPSGKSTRKTKSKRVTTSTTEALNHVPLDYTPTKPRRSKLKEVKDKDYDRDLPTKVELNKVETKPKINKSKGNVREKSEKSLEKVGDNLADKSEEKSVDKASQQIKSSDSSTLPKSQKVKSTPKSNDKVKDLVVDGYDSFASSSSVASVSTGTPKPKYSRATSALQPDYKSLGSPGSKSKGKKKSNLSAVDRTQVKGILVNNAEEDDRDLREILFPDMFGPKSSSGNNSTDRGSPQRERTPRPQKPSSAPQLDSNSPPLGNVFAGSSFHSSPAPSALPKPMFKSKAVGSQGLSSEIGRLGPENPGPAMPFSQGHSQGFPLLQAPQEFQGLHGPPQGPSQGYPFGLSHHFTQTGPEFGSMQFPPPFSPFQQNNPVNPSPVFSGPHSSSLPGPPFNHPANLPYGAPPSGLPHSIPFSSGPGSPWNSEVQPLSPQPYPVEANPTFGHYADNRALENDLKHMLKVNQGN